jgi:hypothetical protein
MPRRAAAAAAPRAPLRALLALALTLLCARTAAAAHPAGGAAAFLASASAAPRRPSSRALSAAAAPSPAPPPRRRSPWRRPLVVVVTWHSANISWLGALPPSRFQVALYAKGDGAADRCADAAAIPPRVRALLAFCEAAPNAAGREAHTMALFMTQFYDALPRYVYFAHDDCADTVPGLSQPSDTRMADAAGQCRVLSLALLAPRALRAWLAAREAAPGDAFADERSCLCSLNFEPAFRACALGVPVPAGSCYGEGYLPMAWLLRTFLDLEPSAWEHVRWATHAQLGAPRAALRARPRLLYTLLLQLLSADLDGGDAAPARHASEAPALLHVYSPEPIAMRWTSLQWAHSMERLWLAVFDAGYSPYKYGNRTVW